MELGTKIRDFRRERGITIASLASRLEISTSYLSAVERGLRKPSIPMLKKISEALNFSVAYLVGSKDDAVTSEKLRFMRQNRNLTLEEFSEISEIPVSMLQRFEAGTAKPGNDELKRMSEALNLPMDYFMYQVERGNVLGTRIKKTRLEQGLTITSLADKVGVSPGLISQIEKGQTIPLLQTLDSLAEALNKPTSYFLVDSEDVEDILSSLNPDVLEMLTDSKVQAILRSIKDFDKKEIEFILNYIDFFKRNSGFMKP